MTNKDRMIRVEDALIDVDKILHATFTVFPFPQVIGLKHPRANHQLTVVTDDGREFYFYETTMDEFDAMRKEKFDE